jgi:hypothetical protein
MELREFISTVLVSVVRGVEDAQSALRDSKATINPLGIKAQIALQQAKETPEFSQVDFEVAVEVSSKNGQEGKAGIQVAVFNMGISGARESSTSHASTLRFAIPVHLPPGDVLKSHLD